MKKYSSLLICFRLRFMLFLFLLFSCEPEEAPTLPPTVLPFVCEPTEGPVVSFAEKLRALPDFSVVGTDTGDVYEVTVRQPVDHNDPGGAFFEQRVYIDHRDVCDPVEIRTAGYELFPFDILGDFIPSNFISVEHRYFGRSTPEDLDWKYLTIEQAAADHHKIIESLKTIYPNRWISTGQSKGGKTALIHRRFYPEDVDVTVALVAPIILGLPDPRFKAFFNSAEREGCQNRIKAFQRLMLERKEALIPLINQDLEEANLVVSMETERLIEYTILEYEFYFWQYGGRCDFIPYDEASDKTMVSYLRPILRYFSDQNMKSLIPFHYQAYTQMGYYEFNFEHLEDLLTTRPRPSYRFFGPENVDMVYDNTAMQDVSDWLTASGNNIIYIYGEDDPYTAAGITPGPQIDALKIVQLNAAHRVSIEELNERQLVYETLERWLGVEIE